VRRPLLLSVVLLLLAAVPANAAFSYSISKISPSVKQRINGKSWHKGCPVPLSGLRYVRVRYWDFDKHQRTGELIVNRDAAGAIVRVFRQLYKNDYRIRRMRLVDDYGASDFRSIEADNTSAFNCRFVDGTRRWSNHAYGRAIDVNPIENPYVTGSGTTSHPRSRKYIDRSSRRHRAMILRGDKTVRAFRAEGWGWGGNFSGYHDYQHFSANGR
jgi:D-alanyl-D-alanine carboxypeptidase